MTNGAGRIACATDVDTVPIGPSDATGRIGLTARIGPIDPTASDPIARIGRIVPIARTGRIVHNVPSGR